MSKRLSPQEQSLLRTKLQELAHLPQLSDLRLEPNNYISSLKGISNLKNSCFLNVILQCLCHTIIHTIYTY